MNAVGPGPDWVSWATVVTAFILALVFVVPMFLGADGSELSFILEGLVAIVITWTAAFAAGNLNELRAARFAEVEPLLDVSLIDAPQSGDPQTLFEVVNRGPGAAKEIQARMWRLETDPLDRWYSCLLPPRPGGTLLPGEGHVYLSPVRIAGTGAALARKALGQASPVADVVIEVQCKTAVGGRRRVVTGFRRRYQEGQVFVEQLWEDDLPALVPSDREQLIRKIVFASPDSSGVDRVDVESTATHLAVTARRGEEEVLGRVFTAGLSSQNIAASLLQALPNAVHKFDKKRRKQLGASGETDS